MTAGRKRLAALADLRERRTLKFTFRDADGIEREGFLAWFKGRVVCYQNVCRHVPITLDYGDGQFFDRAGAHFVCQTHGAVYEPLTGECVAGPCAGAFLKPIEVVADDGQIWIETAPARKPHQPG